MLSVATTKMSSKGQVVIPEALRDRLNLKPGSQFVVLGEGDVVILKSLSAPSMEEFGGLIREARQQAKAASLTPNDITDSIKRVRDRA